MDKDKYEKIKWVKEYETFIKELAVLNQIICDIETLIKSNGISKKSVEKSIKLLNTEKNNSFIDSIKKELEKYFNFTMKQLPLKEKILCCSDIIESAFGKYKNYLSNNPMAGITDLALCIPAFTCELTQDNIKEALECTTMKNLNEWTKENIGTTLFAKRKMAFARIG